MDKQVTYWLGIMTMPEMIRLKEPLRIALVIPHLSGGGAESVVGISPPWIILRGRVGSQVTGRASLRSP